MTRITKYCALSSAVMVFTLSSYIANAIEAPKVATPTVKVNPTMPKVTNTGSAGSSGKIPTSGAINQAVETPLDPKTGEVKGKRR